MCVLFVNRFICYLFGAGINLYVKDGQLVGVFRGILFDKSPAAISLTRKKVVRPWLFSIILCYLLIHISLDPSTRKALAATRQRWKNNSNNRHAEMWYLFLIIFF